MEFDLGKTYLGIDYSEFAKKVISFPDFLIENHYTITDDDLVDISKNYTLKPEIKNLFSKYIQRCHLDLKWVSDVIDEYQEDMYFHLLHIANVGLKINWKNENTTLSTAEQFTIQLTNDCVYEKKGQWNAELSNKIGKMIPNYGYLIFLDFKSYLKDRIKPAENNDFPENDFSENEDKEKLINLEKLKILDFVKSIQTNPEKISHTAEILSSITGIKSSTLYTYLRPMLSSNRDDGDKNSPYKNKQNILNANKTIQKLKIKNLDADS